MTPRPGADNPSALLRYCRIDPGPVSMATAMLILRIHPTCTPGTCMQLQRARQAMDPELVIDTGPPRAVSDEEIAAVLAEIAAAKSVIDRAMQRQETVLLINATAELRAAERARDVLFIRACPATGIVPAVLARKFTLTYAQAAALARAATEHPTCGAPHTDH